MTKEIKLGYELETAKPVTVKPSHLIATGITQLSGKTTVEEALISRSGVTAIVFKTKVGETGFTEGTLIAPYFKERSDWMYVSSLLEATLKEKLKFERAWIIQVCKNADSLLHVKANIDKKLVDPKVKGLSRNIYTTLQAYFELILPQLEYANFSRTLTLNPGINIMDLERFSEEIQSLVIRSVLETVLKEFKGVRIVMPEAWKFLPQGRGNPCKRATEAFIRQGATNENYLLIDSQDMAGVDKLPLKQVSTWLLGLQQERNEVKHTLDQISLPKKLKPKPEEIMRLKLGHFILVTPEKVVRIYAQPAWLDDETAIKVAKGDLEPGSLAVTTKKKGSQISTKLGYKEAPALVDLEAQKFYTRISKRIVDLRHDFFSKITELQTMLDALRATVTELKTMQPKLDVDEVVSLVLQKMPMVNKEEIIAEVLKRVPKIAGSAVYEVAPLEKLRKDFQQYAKDKILGDVQGLDDPQKKMLKFMEATGKGTNITEVMKKCLFLNATSGGSRSRTGQRLQQMANLELIRKDDQNRYYPNLKEKILGLMARHEATPEEMDAVYNHVLMEI